MKVFLGNESQQLKFAASIAKAIVDVTDSGFIIFLEGDLGTGKTTFVRGFLQSLGHTGNVKSPTYTLVEPYIINSKHIYHFDLYRLSTPDELEYAGGRDYFDGESICLIEWPEKAHGYLPTADITCCLSYENQADIQGRACEMIASTPRGQKILQSLSH